MTRRRPNQAYLDRCRAHREMVLLELDALRRLGFARREIAAELARRGVVSITGRPLTARALTWMEFSHVRSQVREIVNTNRIIVRAEASAKLEGMMLSSAAASAVRTLDRAAKRAAICMSPADRALIRRCAEVIVGDVDVPPREIAPILFLAGRRAGRSRVADYLRWRETHSDYTG